MNGKLYCHHCKAETPDSYEIDNLPTNQSVLKLLEFKKNEEKAREKIKQYEIQNPKFFKKIEETVKRKHMPLELQLTEIS